MKTVKHYLVKEIKGREENAFIADYFLQNEKPTEIKEGWEVVEIEVNILDSLHAILIHDLYDSYIHGIVKINSDVQSLQNVINAVRSIDGYNNDMLFELIWTIFEGEQIEIPEDKVYF